ncbi:MAG: ABC transporter substrate-binding protein [Ilumatobacteraceae bacterium]
MRRHRLLKIAILAGLVIAAACTGGSSITDSGDATGTTAPDSSGGAATTLAPTTTVAADTLPDCPADPQLLADHAGTVELTFWHGMSGPLGAELDALAAEYNASQPKVAVSLVGGNYEEALDKYLQSNQESRPDVIQLPEYTVQSIIDTESTVPVGKCIEATGFDTSSFLPSALSAYASQGMQWAMPFNISNPVLFYNKRVFEAAGLDPDKPPTSLDEMCEYSQAIVDSGASAFGLALESGFDSGGGWYVEQWFCKAQEYYTDGDNGRSNRATKVLYNNDTGVGLLTFLQQMVTDGLAVNVGDNSGTGYDNLLKLADQQQAAAMTIATSASLGPVLDVLGSGQFPNISRDDVGVGPMPGPDGAPGALIGGAALWVVNHDDPLRAAAAWDFVQFLVGAEQQSAWAAATGYVPVRNDARDIEPYSGTLAADPRFGVALDQLLSSPDALTSSGPVVGPLREIRAVLAIAVAAILDGADVQASLDDAAAQANGLIADYNLRNS